MVAIPIIETVTNLLTTALKDGGLPMLFLLMTVESFGIPPLPSEIIIPFAGFLVATGDLSFTGALLAILLGGLAGAYIAYAIGRWGRHWIVRGGTGWFRLDPRHLAAMDRWFEKHGEGTVLVARLVPIIRAYISYPAGTARMEPVRFGVFTLVGATPFALVLLYAGIRLEADWSAILPYFHLLDYAAAAFLVATVAYVTLRWRGWISGGFPPRYLRRSAPSQPQNGAPPG
ncbi:MAG: DedA family protein [Thermoplasmata archaeon]